MLVDIMVAPGETVTSPVTVTVTSPVSATMTVA